MRRYTGVAEASALTLLTLALCCAAVAGAELPARGSGIDMGSALMLRVFGETSDSRASFAATLGDRISESPFRELALQVAAPEAKSYGISTAAQFAQDQLTMRDLATQGSPANDAGRFGTISSAVRFSQPSIAIGTAAATPSTALFAAPYEPEPPAPNISPAPGTIAFAPPQLHGADFLSTPAQTGLAQFDSRDNATQTVDIASHDASYDGGANFDLRAGKRNLNLNLSSEYEHVASASDSASLNPAPNAPAWQVPGVGASLAVPNYADVNLLSLGAGVSVPVVHGLTLNLNYDAQRLYGAYGLPGLANLDTINNSYGGGLTFDIPRMSSSLSISAFQDRFQDSLLPINGSTQTREDVNFTVKF